MIYYTALSANQWDKNLDIRVNSVGARSASINAIGNDVVSNVHLAHGSDVFPSTSLQAIQFLLPHMTKSIELGRSFHLLRKRYEAVLTAPDRVQIEICIALSDGHVIITNSQADRNLGNADVLVLDQKRRLRIRPPAQNAKL